MNKKLNSITLTQLPPAHKDKNLISQVRKKILSVRIN